MGTYFPSRCGQGGVLISALETSIVVVDSPFGSAATQARVGPTVEHAPQARPVRLLSRQMKIALRRPGPDAPPMANRAMSSVYTTGRSPTVKEEGQWRAEDQGDFDIEIAVLVDYFDNLTWQLVGFGSFSIRSDSRRDVGRKRLPRVAALNPVDPR